MLENHVQHTAHTRTHNVYLCTYVINIAQQNHHFHSDFHFVFAFRLVFFNMKKAENNILHCFRFIVISLCMCVAKMKVVLFISSSL